MRNSEVDRKSQPNASGIKECDDFLRRKLQKQESDLPEMFPFYRLFYAFLFVYVFIILRGMASACIWQNKAKHYIAVECSKVKFNVTHEFSTARIK